MKKSFKQRMLRNNDTLNPHPEGVHDPLFQENAFFDANDLLQVKYEMLRRVHNDGWTVTRAADSFGISRVSYYKADRVLQEDGLNGLLPHKRGPKGAHKLTEAVLDYGRTIRAEEPDLLFEELIERIAQRFGIRVHQRTLERALVGSKKKHRSLSK
jgi:transposase